MLTIYYYLWVPAYTSPQLLAYNQLRIHHIKTKQNVYFSIQFDVAKPINIYLKGLPLSVNITSLQHDPITMQTLWEGIKNLRGRL